MAPQPEGCDVRALCWNGVNDLEVQTVPDPTIISPHDAIVP
jgi:hypothetical protein